MSWTCIDTADAVELAETLQLIADWLATDREPLAASLLGYIGHPAYGPDAPPADLDRFAFPRRQRRRAPHRAATPVTPDRNQCRRHCQTARGLRLSRRRRGRAGPLARPGWAARREGR
ncbi:MAG TPA: hypothetical protein VGG54_04690, partial [Trebonia sp.]